MYTTQISDFHLQKESFVFDPRPRFHYQIAVNRYWVPEYQSTDSDAITLILAHGNAAHKELWEPTLLHLYKFLLAFPGSAVKIRDAWCVDAPNHGDSAILNDDILERSITFLGGAFPSFSWEDYARSIHLFIAGQGAGVDVDFSTRKLVGIGHCLGAVALMLSTTYLPDIKFSSMILAEPMIVRKPKPGETNFDITEYTMNRRDIWPTRDAALQYFKSSSNHCGWDAEVLERYARFGLRSLPTAMYPDIASGITLKCHKAQQSAAFYDRQSNIRAYDYLHVFCKALPVHLIYGSCPDFLPKSFQQDVLTVASRGLYTTVSEVDGSGHSVLQAHPHGLAQRIRDALVYRDPPTTSLALAKL